MINDTCWLYTFLNCYLDLKWSPTNFDSRKYLYSFPVFLFSLFVLYSFQYIDLPNPLLRSFDNFWLSIADNMTTGTYNFESLIVKIISSSLVLTLSTAAAKKHCLAQLSFNSPYQLINEISSDRQKLLRYFNSTAIVPFLEFRRYYLVCVKPLFLLLI